MAQTPLATVRARLALTAANLLARTAQRFSARRDEATGTARGVSSILVIELWNMGDVILVMPFLQQLRRLFPQARILLLARAFARELLVGTGLVDEVIVADLNWTPESRFRLRRLGNLWSVTRVLRAHRFDLAFSARPHLREHILLALSNAKRKIGYTIAATNAGFKDAIPVGEPRHKVDEWSRLLATFGGPPSTKPPRLCVSDAERDRASRYLISRGFSKNDLLIGVHPGASLPEKRWPLEQFREVTESLAGQAAVKVLAFAEPGGYGSELFAIPGVIGARVGLRELIALIACCDLLVCNDSGPMHIAGALGVPTVAMFGSEINEWFAPLGDGHETLTPELGEVASPSRPTRGGIRVPSGIGTSSVLDAVRRVVRRSRRGRSFSTS